MRELFEKAEKATSLSELNGIIASDSTISKTIKEFEHKYPRFDLQIKPQQVQQLKENRFLNEDHTINLEREAEFTPFEKFLLAVLWKNGQIFRVQPIVDGIVGIKKSESEFGIIFNQFGRHLADPTEPIVDQHVLRAFCEATGRKKVPRKTVFKTSDQKMIDEYRNWFKIILQRITEQEKEEFRYKLDKLLFTIGKQLE
ncbi:MAG: hypothetical protein ABW019_04495 [Chitinophagaceae bacterium]